MHSPRRFPAKSARLILFVAHLVLLAGCNSDEVIEAPAADAASQNPAASLLPASDAAAADCIDGGALETTLFGALSGEIIWTPDELACQGMPRPDGAGARLRFSGTVGEDATSIAFIIGIPGLEKGRDAVELPSNVTVIEENNSRFFSTADLDTCWTDIEGQWLLDEDNDDGRYRIDGVMYCISPLAEVNGDDSVSIPELQFSGLLDWNAK